MMMVLVVLEVMMMMIIVMKVMVMVIVIVMDLTKSIQWLKNQARSAGFHQLLSNPEKQTRISYFNQIVVLLHIH